MTREYIRKIDKIQDPNGVYEEFLNKIKEPSVTAKTMTLREAVKKRYWVDRTTVEGDGYLVYLNYPSRFWVAKSAFDKMFEMVPTSFERYKESIENMSKENIKLLKIANTENFCILPEDEQFSINKRISDNEQQIAIYHSYLKMHKDDYDELIRSGWDWNKC